MSTRTDYQTSWAIANRPPKLSRQDSSPPSKGKLLSPSTVIAAAQNETALVSRSLRMRVMIPTYIQVSSRAYGLLSWLTAHDLSGYEVVHPHRLPTPANASRSNDCTQSDSEPDSRRASTALDEAFTNPLVSGNSVYIADRSGQPCESCCERMPSYKGLTRSLLQSTSGHPRIVLLADAY